MTKDITSLSQSLRSIDSSLRSLVVLEEKTNQILKELQNANEKTTEIEKRLLEIEKELPQFRMTSKYALAAVVAIVGAVGAALLKLIGLK